MKKQYAWRHYYWFLTDEGINHLREILHLPNDILPETQKKTASSVAPVDGDGRRSWRDRGVEGRERRSGYGGRGGGSDRACYNCGQTGHLARYVDDFTLLPSLSHHALSTFTSLPSTPYPHNRDCTGAEAAPAGDAAPAAAAAPAVPTGEAADEEW